MLVSLALITGVVGGLGAILFRLMIDWAGRGIRELFWLLPGVPRFPPPRHDLAVLAPAVGLVLVGVIGQYLASEVRGHGIPQVLEALALRGGRIRPRVALLGIVAPAVTIGSGGSVGQEGPIALIGASFGSVIGQLLRLSGGSRRLPPGRLAFLRRRGRAAPGLPVGEALARGPPCLV